jgi:hypothetical protein
MEMIGGSLSLFLNHELFAIGFGILGVGHATIAKGDEQQTDLVEIATSEIGDVPSQHIAPQFVIFLTGLAFPFFGCLKDEGGKSKFLLLKEGNCLAHKAIDF